MNRFHLIKLLVGIDTLQTYYNKLPNMIMEYNDQPAIPCWTRYRPKHHEELLKQKASIYRVIKNRIVCRHIILGFEYAQTKEKGKMCMILQDPRIIQTMAMPKRPFQGWRYIQNADVPPDLGIYDGQEDDQQTLSKEMEKELRSAGLL